MPNLSLPIQDGTMPAYPVMPHIPGAHDTIYYGPHVPPVYVVEASAFTEPVIVRVTYVVDRYAEMEKDVQIKEEDLITSQLHSIQVHDTEECDNLRNRIEFLIKNGTIKCTPAPPNVNSNSLPNHGNQGVNIITLDEEYDMRKIMQAVKVREKKESDDVKISKTAKMVASEMLKYRYQPKIRLGVKSDGIIEPIQLKHQNNTFGLGYESTLGKLHNMHLEKKVFMREQDLVVGPEIVPEPDECIIEEMYNMFIEMTEEEYGKNEVDLKIPTIHDAEPGEVLQN
ncbi:hypothetical protein HAX54_005742 [Datura stramonium]|uniref:Uncharacterized protein n=1 Tax=Datura stramonium TaxID=4076 RepID=A0ABS8WTK4_DATST|nr:hypothetical protein [Datura stramonium]